MTDVMQSLLEIILGGLVTFRLALMFSKESGPGRIFKRLRNLPPDKSAAKEGLACLHCQSVWWAAPIAVFGWWRGKIEAMDAPLYWLAFSGLAIILHHFFTADFKK